MDKQAGWPFFRDFVRALGVEARRLAFWSHSIKVVRDDSVCLELLADSRRIVADRLARTVTVGARTVASFENIQSIEVKVYDSHDGPEWWTIALHLSNRRRLALGRTSDDAEASIAAARLGTITGKKVVAVR